MFYMSDTFSWWFLPILSGKFFTWVCIIVWLGQVVTGPWAAIGALSPQSHPSCTPIEASLESNARLSSSAHDTPPSLIFACYKFIFRSESLMLLAPIRYIYLYMKTCFPVGNIITYSINVCAANCLCNWVQNRSIWLELPVVVALMSVLCPSTKRQGH